MIHDKYHNLIRQGPFPGQIDPWVEQAHYFQQLHAELISALLGQLQDPLFDMGYVAGREASLLIAEGREPDLYLRTDSHPDKPMIPWSYELAAAEALTEPGIRVEDEADTQAIHIKSQDNGDLVTVVEIVSPGNKTKAYEISAYQERRTRLFLEKGVNVVEIDLTRSVKRLTVNSITAHYPYHLALFVPHQAIWVLGIEFNARLNRFALPLRGEVMPTELHQAYEQAYVRARLAWHIQHEGRYGEDHLPFPSLLTSEQRERLLKQVEVWKSELDRLKPSS